MNAHLPINARLPQHLASLGMLAQLELEVRTADDLPSLRFMAVNDLHKIVPYDHALFWQPREGITAISGGLVIEPAQPQIRCFAQVAEWRATEPVRNEAGSISIESLPSSLRAEASRWFVGECAWVPLTAPPARLLGGVILLRSKPFGEAEFRLLARLGTAYGSALAALASKPRTSFARVLRTRRAGIIVAALALAALALPVRLSVLADAKVVPLEPRAIAAPIDGVIKAMHVRPNQPVAAADLLWSLEETELVAARDIAEKRVMVLAAEQARAEQSGFREARARSELAVLQSKLAEGETELAYAQERVSRANVRSPSAGIALFDDPVSWIGRPVRIGERVMLVADPTRVRLEIAIAIEDGLAVEAGAEVEFFLAVSPDQPLPAKLQRISHDARILPSQVAAFVADADFDAGRQVPRLGSTGTAKIYGQRVTLFYALLRKPMASLRRLVGY